MFLIVEVMHKVTITDSGEEFHLPHKSHLTDAEELDVTGLKFGCRKGVCGMCVIEILSGKENLPPAKEKERTFLNSLGYEQENARLACQCQLLGDIELSTL